MFDLIRQMRRSSRHLACNNPLYHWSLGGNVPDRLLVKPVDLWAGNARAGHWICDGAFVLDEDQRDFGIECWETNDADQAWLIHMHSFVWLRDLRAMGGAQARRQAREMILSWIRHFKRWDQLAWRPDIAGERVAMWIAHFEFFDESRHDEEINHFQDQFFDSLARQARHVAHNLPGNQFGLSLLKGLKGLIYAGLAFEGRESWIVQGLSILEKELQVQILSDGSHISRSPSQLLESLQALLDIRTALNTGGYPLPECVQHAIDRMVPALRFFRYADKALGLFHGAQEGNIDLIDSVLAQSGVGSKALNSLPCAGFERATLGRTSLVFDCGLPSSYPHDLQAHAAPLAFEMSYGKDRLFVSCGSHPFSDDWKDALRQTPAHNALTIEHRNAFEIKDNGHFARKAKVAAPVRETTKQTCLLEGTHDGYAPLYGLTHRRRLYLGDQGHDFRGEDALHCAVELSRPLGWAVRFHIHPRVIVSLIRDGTEALLRLPNGIGWRFHQSGGTLALDDSLYLGSGSRPRKTKQLVIYGQINEKEQKIKWALQREGGH